MNSNSDTLIQYVENTLTLLADRITRLGTGYTHYWYISAACALLKLTVLPEQATAQKQEAIDKVARQYYRVLASQEDILKAKERILPRRLHKVSSTDTELNRPY